MLRLTVLPAVLMVLVPLAPSSCPLTGGPDGGVDPNQIREQIPTTAQISTDRAEVGDVLTLIADAVAPADGGEVQYSWLQTNGVGAAITDPTAPLTSVTAPSVDIEQELRFMVTTRNEAGAVGQAEVGLVVAADPLYGQREFDIGGGGGPTGTGPQADAGEPQEALEGDQVTLDGSRSTGRSLTYSWSKVSGRNVQLNNASSQKASFAAPAYDPDGDNTFVFQLRVTDDRTRVSSDQVSVEVLNPQTVGPRVLLQTSFGDIVVELYEDEAPNTVDNFLQYVDDGFYTNTIFHRVIQGFVVQGGGFLPGLTQKDTRDPIELESNTGLSNTRATVAMARTNDPDSATSQFYFNLVDNSNSLDYKNENTPGYAVFGRVFSGMDVVDRIATVKTESRNGFDDVPVQDIYIRSATRLDGGGGSVQNPF